MPSLFSSSTPPSRYHGIVASRHHSGAAPSSPCVRVPEALFVLFQGARKLSIRIREFISWSKMAHAAWDARCQACGAIGDAANTLARRYVQPRQGDWRFQCCQQCARSCAASLGAEAFPHVDVKLIEEAVDEQLVNQCEQRWLSSSGRRDFDANQRRRLQ